MIVIVIAVGVVVLVIGAVTNNHNDNGNIRNSYHLHCYLKFSQQLCKVNMQTDVEREA